MFKMTLKLNLFRISTILSVSVISWNLVRYKALRVFRRKPGWRFIAGVKFEQLTHLIDNENDEIYQYEAHGS